MPFRDLRRLSYVVMEKKSILVFWKIIHRLKERVKLGMHNLKLVIIAFSGKII